MSPSLQVLARDEVRARVWERGVGLTLACGSAACATLVAAARLGLMDRKGTVRLPGGDLIIEWRALGRPRADDRPGRIRRRVHSRRGLVRSRDVVIAEAGADDSASKRSRRVDAIDCARGLALVGMAIYHLSWDLADFRLAPPWLPFTPQMRLFSHVVASAFLVLVGVSLALAHRKGLNPRAFWRRLAIVAGAAALVTAGSFVFAPSEPITFGILHCIAVASLLAWPFVIAPAWASFADGLRGDRARRCSAARPCSIRPGSSGWA